MYSISTQIATLKAEKKEEGKENNPKVLVRPSSKPETISGMAMKKYTRAITEWRNDLSK